MKYIPIFLLLFVALSGNAKESSPSIEIIQPLDQTLYIGENATFVIKEITKGADTIVITQDNNHTTTLKVTPVRRTYCKTIRLHVGGNRVVVTAYKENKPVGRIERKLYFLSELFEGLDEDEAEEYEQRYFHADEKENRCKACHNMRSNVPTDGEAFEDVSQTTCFNCHKGMINTRNTHAPAANWLCLDCHDGKFGEYNMEDEGASKYLVRDPVARSCGSCHDDVAAWNHSRYVHGPVNDGRCERCHNPHGSENEFFLRKPIWELCTTCHAEKADGKHVISSFVFGTAHPTRGKPDPSRPGRELVCSSCHNPHGSEGIFMLRTKSTIPFSICNRCHDKR